MKSVCDMDLKTSWRHLAVCAAVSGVFAVAMAQEVEEATEPEDEPALSLTGQTEKLSFTTDEGTWISLDITPDGETIVFELLGDLLACRSLVAQQRP